MRTRTLLLVAFVAVFGAAGAGAQEATEIFIPIGESPGVSGTKTVIGRIVSIDRENHTLTVVNDAGTHVIRIADTTRIWLDRSKMKQSNEYGAMTDCRKGRLCEVKFDPERALEPAEWVKIQFGP